MTKLLKPFYLLLLALRSLLYTLCLSVFIFFYAFILCGAYPFVGVKGCRKLITAWSYVVTFLAKWILGIRYEIIGHEHIAKGNGVILAKHSSTWETFILPSIFGTPAVIIKHELLHIPFFGWGIRTIQPIAINRKETGSAMEQILAKGKKQLDDGGFVLIFPEGTRVPLTDDKHYRIGGALLAAKSGYPIIPVAHDSAVFWPKGSFLKKPGKATLIIGEPIDSKGKKPEELLQITKDWIQAEVAKLLKSNENKQ